MPEHKGPDLQEDRHRAKYDYISFMEQMTQGGLRGVEGVNGHGQGHGHGHGHAQEGY